MNAVVNCDPVYAIRWIALSEADATLAVVPMESHTMLPFQLRLTAGCVPGTCALLAAASAPVTTSGAGMYWLARIL